MIRGMDAQVPRYIRAQTYAAELTSDQAAVFDLCRAGATWFYNEACASQLDRYRHGAGIESNMSLGYAVSVARKVGVEFPYRGTMRLISDVPAMMLHGALRQLSASWTRHLKALADWEKRPRSPGGRRPVEPSGVPLGSPGRLAVLAGAGRRRPRARAASWYRVTRKATRDRPALALFRVPGKIGPVVIRYHRELPADTMVRFASLRVDDLGRYWVTFQYDTAQVRQPAAVGHRRR